MQIHKRSKRFRARTFSSGASTLAMLLSPEIAGNGEYTLQLVQSPLLATNQEELGHRQAFSSDQSACQTSATTTVLQK